METSHRTIVFAGNLGNWTLPGDFLNDCERLFSTLSHLKERYRIRILGTQHEEAKEQLKAFRFPELLQIDGHLPKDAADRLMRESSALLLLTPRNMERYIPGKLFEYIASGRPIIVHGNEGESSRIVSKLHAGFFVPTSDTGALKHALTEIDTNPPGHWNNDARRKWVMAHTRQFLAKQLFDLLEKL